MSSKRKPADSEVLSISTAGQQEYQGSDNSRERTTSVKRQRVSRACDQCRAAREKCDGIQPLCFPCVSQNRPCTYQANPKKRGVQTGYIRTLELALAWVFEKVPGSENALITLLSHEGGQGQRLLTGSDSAAANRLHQKWRRSRVHKGIDRVLSGGASIPSQDDKSPSPDMPSDVEGDVHRPPLLPFAPGNPEVISHRAQTSPETYSSASFEARRLSDDQTSGGKAVASSLLPPSRTLPVASRGLRLPSNHWRLMDIYFSYTHCWLPILEKQEMFQASYLYSSEHGLELSPDDPSSGTHAELWSALAVASFQDAASSGPSIAASGSMSPSQIYNIARSLVPAEDGPFQVHHSRALILLSLVSLGRRNLTTSWLLIGRAVRMFLDISLREASDNERQQQRLHSVLIACFVMDTMVSQHHEKPPHLTSEDMVEAMNISENDLDEWQPWAGCEGFGQGNEGSHTYRNPAYCLSTFNQLYEIFKVVSRYMGERRARPGRNPRTAVGLPELQQAVNLRAPFGRYILSADIDSAPMPSPYLLKITYLWAAGIVDRISSSTVHLMLGVMGHYQTRFGTCAMPPFFAACLSSWVNHAGLERLHEQDRTRLTALEACCSSIWDAKQAGGFHDTQDHESQHTSMAYRHAIQPDAQRDAVPSSVDSSTSFLRNVPAYATSVPSGESPSSVHGGHDLSNTYIFPDYRNPRGLLSPAATATTQDTINDIGNSMAAQVAPGRHVQTQYRTLFHPGLSAAPRDYDALLDDLASIDCTDRIEADPQFMANLGFAPGCDLSDILSLDFGTF